MGAHQSVRERLRFGLGLRLIGLVVLAVLATGGTIGTFVIASSREAIRADILNRNLETADLAARFAADYVDGAEASLRQLGARSTFIRAVLDRDLEEAERDMEQLMQIGPRFDNIAVYDAQGIGWASGLKSKWQNRGGTVADREWFQQTLATRKSYLGIPILSRGTGHPVVSYIVPIFDEREELRAMLVGGISLAALSDAITGIRVSASARASLMDARQGGIILAHSDPTRILQPITGQNEAALRAVAGERGALETRSSSGELDLAAFAPVPRLPWSILLLEPAQIAFAPVDALTRRALALTGIVMSLAAILGVLLTRTITQPLRQLVQGAGEVGKGNLDYRIPIKSKDEIGQLASAFNTMATDLRQSLGEIAHAQRVLLALSQAAQAVQRAHTPDEIYRAVGEAVTGLGYHAMIFSLSEDQKHLTPTHLTFDSDLLRAGEKLVGISAQGFQLDVKPGSLYAQVIAEGKTFFSERGEDAIADSLPNLARPLAGRLAALFGIEQVIYAPLASGGVPGGLLLEVVGKGLSETDVPAIATFANQTAIALENARLYQETRDWALEMEQRVTERTGALRESEEKYRNLFANAQVGMYRSKLDGSAILEVNQKLADIFGHSVEEMLASPATIRWADPAARAEMVRQLQEKGNLRDYEIAVVTGSGAIKTVLISLELYPQAEYLEGSAVDITERKRAEETLRETSEYLENLINYANAPIIVWNPLFRITRFNRAFEALTGRKAEAVIGESLDILFPSAEVDSSMELIRKTLTGERWETVEIPVLHLDGSAHVVLWNSATLFAPDGMTPLATIAQGQDITERKRAEESLAQKAVALERSNRELEQFAYVASHDLQEPLRMVSSYTQLLAERYEGQLDDKAKTYIDYAVDGATRMQRLINDLLAYSRISTRGKPPEPTDSHAALGEALRNLSAAIEESRAIVSNDDLPTVRADAGQLPQVFQNLIANAIKFHGADAPRVFVAARDMGHEWEFSVKDNGIGIDEKYADRLFAIFQRLHTRDEYPGTGIGLAVCKSIVERHGGRIWFESVPGKGSTFYFTLPKSRETVL